MKNSNVCSKVYVIISVIATIIALFRDKNPWSKTYTSIKAVIEEDPISEMSLGRLRLRRENWMRKDVKTENPKTICGIL